MIDQRPQDHLTWERDQYLHESETKTIYYETKTEVKSVVSRPHWFWDLNIPAQKSVDLVTWEDNG